MVKDFKDIREFICLAEVCSYQEASELLFISTSALSKHIMALEEVLGVSLFDRSTRRVSLTKYGEVFYKYAQEMVKLYDDCTNEINELRIDRDSYLRVGFLNRLEQCGVIEMISDFLQVDNGIRIDTIGSNHPAELLKDQKCDFIFDFENTVRKKDYNSILLRSDNLVAVLPKDHPLAQEDCINLEQLKDERFIIHSDAAQDTEPQFLKSCREAGFEPYIAMTASYTSTIVKLVRQGNGIALMNRMSIPQTILSSVATVKVTPEVEFHIYVIYPKKEKMTESEKKFIKFIRSQIVTEK